MRQNLLGGMSVRAFLRDYWQNKPLLVRGAFPGFRGLINGSGRRRWRISAQPDTELVPDAPLRILKRFAPDQEWIVEPGDMLYLPPAYAHDGVAVDECTTYSIGFRAPSAQEIGEAFLDHLRDVLDLSGRYADPNLPLQREPAAIGAAMTAQVAVMLEGIWWNRREVASFLGGYLTEPKPRVFFTPPRVPLSRRRFLAWAERDGVALALASRMLYDGRRVYLNGDAYAPGREAAVLLRRMANHGALPAGTPFGAEVADLLYGWYRAGYVALRPAPRPAG